MHNYTVKERSVSERYIILKQGGIKKVHSQYQVWLQKEKVGKKVLLQKKTESLFKNMYEVWYISTEQRKIISFVRMIVYNNIN